MTERAFPVVFAEMVESSAAFYEILGFQRHFQLPPDGEAGYVGLRRGSHELAVVAADWPRQQYDKPVAVDGVKFELFVYVEAVDALVETLRASGVAILREPADMPWGERVAYVSDPDGNPIALAVGPDTNGPQDSP
jgi:lactoylglutathione lyase